MLMVTDVHEIIKRHQAQIITSLKDPDIRSSYLIPFNKLSSFILLYNFVNHIFISPKYSIRRRSLDLLYGMCDVTNAKDIVEELLQVCNFKGIIVKLQLPLPLTHVLFF